MNAIRVAKRGKGAVQQKLTMVHGLLDPERTFCGLKPADLDVQEQLELEKLPALNGCRACARVLDGWTQDPRWGGGERRYLHAGPEPGRSRRVGSLSHGTRISRGNRIGG